MNPLRLTALFFAPTRQYVEAQIIELTPEIAEAKMHRDWWDGPRALEIVFPGADRPMVELARDGH